MIKEVYNNYKNKFENFVNKHKKSIWFYPAVTGFIFYQVATKGACTYFAYQGLKKSIDADPLNLISRKMDLCLDSIVYNAKVTPIIYPDFNQTNQTKVYKNQ